MSKAERTRHSSSALLPPFHGASETERLLPRVDNVCPIRDPIQQRFTQSGIWKHRGPLDRKSTRLNSSHLVISYAVFCLKKKKKETQLQSERQPDMLTLLTRGTSMLA